MKHLLVSVYQVLSNKSPGVKIGTAPGVFDFPCMHIVKANKKSSFKKKLTSILTQVSDFGPSWPSFFYPVTYF
jgi:hypothetical protein